MTSRSASSRKSWSTVQPSQPSLATNKPTSIHEQSSSPPSHQNPLPVESNCSSFPKTSLELTEAINPEEKTSAIFRTDSWLEDISSNEIKPGQDAPVENSRKPHRNEVKEKFQATRRRFRKSMDAQNPW